MKIYMTRHGQVLPKRYYDDDARFPVGNQSLTQLGKEQAHYLGRRLKLFGFDGVIYSSPYTRTLETAQIVAEHVGARIVPAPFMREIFKTREAAGQFEGSDKDEILSKYKNAARDFPLSYPWWGADEEDFEKDVCRRVHSGLRNIKANGDVLLVGHGATVKAAFSYYGLDAESAGPTWNCALSMYDDARGETFLNDVSFMPQEKVSSNVRLLCEDKPGR